jgi:hypothetical protein
MGMLLSKIVMKGSHLIRRSSTYDLSVAAGSKIAITDIAYVM